MHLVNALGGPSYFCVAQERRPAEPFLDQGQARKNHPTQPAKSGLTWGQEAVLRRGLSQLHLHLAGIDHNVVCGAEVAGADDAGGVIAPH